MVAKYGFSNHTEKNVERPSYLKKMFNNFAIHDQFHIPNGLKKTNEKKDPNDMGPKFLHLRYIMLQYGKSSIWHTHISQTIRNMKSIMEDKI